jgi:hypothetical protein
VGKWYKKGHLQAQIRMAPRLKGMKKLTFTDRQIAEFVELDDSGGYADSHME